ncbi:MAG: SRPBCC family protein [Microcella sp.]|uniref:SRPBCC family protein n=1 Tax=Microcella sp. TaxID=1913979 RepID=UPI0024C567D8|nr:SRPBCC family protein [Microcella sp.]UYN83494.1 MAG: SRPBCC family protein [Microcella sp.]
MSVASNPPAVIDDDEFTVSRTIQIAAPLSTVWAAITEPKHLARWFGQTAALDSLAVGARGSVGFEGYGAFPLRIEELDPPRVVAYRWAVRPHDDSATDDEVFALSTLFRFTLDSSDGGTRLTVVETGFGDLPDPTLSMRDNQGGWTSELDELVDYLQGAG